MPTLGPHVCIHKVPGYWRTQGDDRLYVPKIVSIGPYHHGKDSLSALEPHKWRSLDKMLERTGHDKMRYLDALKSIEGKIRACYQVPISFGSDSFALMMMLDGCFLLEILRGANESFEALGYCSDDPVFTMKDLRMLITLQGDFILLENQLPLFVIDLLLEIQTGSHDQSLPVTRLVLNYFASLTPTDISLLMFIPLVFIVWMLSTMFCRGHKSLVQELVFKSVHQLIQTRQVIEGSCSRVDSVPLN